MWIPGHLLPFHHARLTPMSAVKPSRAMMISQNLTVTSIFSVTDGH